NSAAALANPWIAGLLTKSILADEAGALPAFQWILLGWFALLAIKSLLGFASSFLVGSTGAEMAAQMRSRVYEHLQILPMRYYQDRKPGDLLTLLSNDSEAISGFVTNTLVRLLPLILTFLGAFVIMAWLDPLIAGLAALLMPVYYLAMKILGRRIRPITSQWIKSWSGMVALVQENLGLIPAIKAFTREPLEAERFEEKNVDFLGLSRQQILIQSVMSPAISFLAGAGLLLLLWVGISHVESGQLDTAQLVSLLLYAMLLTQPVSGLANVYGQVMHTRGAADRLLEFFGVEPEPVSEGKPPIGELQGAIEFEGIDFAYPGRENVLEGFSLEIAAGETIALTGANGAGKSTLAHLLMRFIDPDRGQIRVDGKNIAEYDLRSLRDQVGLVAQNTLLLNGTVAENIRYGCFEATDTDMKKAAKAARADQFIEALPDGYETVIGDQGVKLSGGQRQRLSLARTLLKDPPILILDEATAMFDPEGEASFIEECHELLSQRTVILITHRPASLALADRVLALPER
ncbi:MAG: ABC transporter ATP-binding protein/permease, partial [Gammaproteobacteria bacterium]|nr:ABC transporter ATP-binding protein/permease [Gammaproteobacteria bacterium]